MSSPQPLAYKYRPSAVIRLFLVPAIGGFLFGYDIGGTSFVVVQLASLSSSSSLSLQDSPLKTGWMVSSPSIGALLGTAFLMYIESIDRNTGAINNNNNNNKSGGKSSKPRSFSCLAKKLLAPIGRRTELRYAGILYAVGGILQFLSAYNNDGPNSIVSAFFLLSLGRWIYGAGIGFAMHGGPTYLAETTPPSVRGMVVGGKEIAIVMGILAGCVVGREWIEHDGGWAYVYAATLAASMAMIGLSYTIPESARYLVSRQQQTNRNINSSIPPGEINNAMSCDDTINIPNATKHEICTRKLSAQVLESLEFVWKPKAALDEHRKLMGIFHRQQQQQQQQKDQLSEDSSMPTSRAKSNTSLLDPYVWPALRAGLGLVVLQQITGQPSVLSYATPILARVPGLSTDTSVLLALFKLVATAISVVLVETRGRKILLTIGCSLMLASLLVLTFAFSSSETIPSSSEDNSTAADTTTTPSSQLDARSILAVLGMFAYIAGYQIGFGPITWLMISEVFPQSVRGRAVALAVLTNFALNALVQLLVPILRSTIGMSKTFAVFGALTAYSVYFVQKCVPETKGLTLEEIEDRLVSLTEASATEAETSHEGDSLPKCLCRKYHRKEDYGSRDNLERLDDTNAENEERVQLISTSTDV